MTKVMGYGFGMPSDEKERERAVRRARLDAVRSGSAAAQPEDTVVVESTPEPSVSQKPVATRKPAPKQAAKPKAHKAGKRKAKAK